MKPNPNEKSDFTFTTEKPIESIDELVKILKTGNYSLCVNGEIKSF